MVFLATNNWELEYLMGEKIFTIEALKYIFWQNVARMYQIYIRKSMKLPKYRKVNNWIEKCNIVKLSFSLELIDQYNVLPITYTWIKIILNIPIGFLIYKLILKFINMRELEARNPFLLSCRHFTNVFLFVKMIHKSPCLTASSGFFVSFLWNACPYAYEIKLFLLSICFLSI